MRRALVAALALTVGAVSLLAAGTRRPPSQAPAFERPVYRPVTDLRCIKSGADVVLNWTTAPDATYRWLVCRGLLAPTFRAEKVVAVIPAGTGPQTWTDVGAVTRTVLGLPINEFYRVYALPGTTPGPALSARTYREEYTERPRDAQQILRMDVTNGEQFPGSPRARVLNEGREGITSASQSSPTSYLLDLYNRPKPGPSSGQVWVNGERTEQYPATVDHSATMAGVLFTPAGGNETIPSSTARTIPTPAIGARVGDAQTVSWTWPTEDTPGSVQQVQLWRSYEGVGNGESSVLVGSYTSATTQATDDLSAVPAGWYVFYMLRLVYVDDTTSVYGPSSAPVQR